MKTPVVSSVVQYTEEWGAVLAGIVTEVYGDGTVHLRLFKSSGDSSMGHVTQAPDGIPAGDERARKKWQWPQA